MQSSSNKYGKLHVVTNGVNESVDNSLDEVHTISTFIIIRYTNNADTLVFALPMSRGKGRGGGGC